MTPTAMFIVERPSTKAPAGRISDIRATRVPLVADMTSHGMAMRRNRHGHGRPGIACSASQTIIVEPTRSIAERGLSRSDRESKSCDPTSCTSGPPNMARAVRTADDVAV